MKDNSRLYMSLATIQESFLEPDLLEIYDQLDKKYILKNNWNYLSEYQIWKELCFCLLSGNVAFELVTSTIKVLEEKGFLNHEWILREKSSENMIFHLFNESNFEPKKKNGKLRKYRYPKKRSEEIIKAAKILYSNSSIKRILRDYSSDVDVRDFLSATIPGIGIKESSHFLRNIGYSNSLAIIDVHVLKFLELNYFVNSSKNSTLTKSRYKKLEIILQNLAEYHKLDLNTFDLAIWHFMRSG